MGLMKELAELNAIYQKMSTPDIDEAMIVTNADKKGNTPAWKGYKSGKKNVKTGKPLYKAADHVKEHHTKDKDGKVIEHEDTTPSSVEEGLVDMVKKGAKRHSKAVEKKKIKNRKAVPYAALGASYQPEGEVTVSYTHLTLPTIYSV